VSPLAGKRLLVLEDEPVIGFAIEDMLEALGCRVTGLAYQTEAALELVALREFDAAVLDVNIAGGLSYAVADALAAKGVPYLFATGYGTDLHPKRHAHAPTVAKPYTTADFEKALLAFFG